MKRISSLAVSGLVTIFLILISCKSMKYPDIALINGKVITVDSSFSIAEALAISGEKIISVGSNSKIKRISGKETQIIDLKGRTVIPGLIDAHLHPDAAAISELQEEIPDVHSMDQLLNWIRLQAEGKTKDSWIIFQKFFPTRLEEMRQPTLGELDNAAPYNPVFLNGSFGGMINSCAMKISGISRISADPGVLKDRITGLPTGFIRASAFHLLKLPVSKPLSKDEWIDAFSKMMKRYNRYGITSVHSGTGDMNTVRMYRQMADSNMLTIRIFQNILFSDSTPVTKESVSEKLKNYQTATGGGNDWVKVGPLKVFLDGGILTGTAYMKEPWGAKASEIFGIEDPSYRGIINYRREELLAIVSAANDAGWSFTAHATGDGSVKMLLGVYNEVNSIKSIRGKRFSIIHGNFFDGPDIRLMKELGVYANIQPAWFYKDADAMRFILGDDKIRIFHPDLTMTNAGIVLNGGSDHMVKWDANASINPYNPFLAMWSMITRTTERGSVIVPEEAISREQALRIYTINNSYASFEESIKGSIEPGKLADIVVITDDFLTCPADRIKDIESLLTIVGGKIVYSSSDF